MVSFSDVRFWTWLAERHMRSQSCSFLRKRLLDHGAKFSEAGFVFLILTNFRKCVTDAGCFCDENLDCRAAMFCLQARQALFSWGKGLAGQLGTGRFSDQLVPKRVRSLNCCHVGRCQALF